MRVAILGGPGSGKGTQAKILAERYRVPQISTGDLLRDAVKTGASLGAQAKEAMAAGKLVDDEVVHKLLEERLRKKDTKRGFIIDGYPRSIPQAQALDTLLGMLGKSLQIAINIDVDDDALVKRIVGRMGCDDCGAIYNRYFSPPKVKTKCDQCGGTLVSRVDDTAKTAQVRIGVYHEETQPLITYYRAQHKLRTMPGMGEVDEIHQKLCDLVDLEIRPLEIKTLETAADSSDELDSTVIAGGQINRVAMETATRKPRPKKKAADKKPASTKTAAKKPVTKAAVRKPVSKKTAQKKKVVTKAKSVKASGKKATASKSASRRNVVRKAAAKPSKAKNTSSEITSSRKPASKTQVKKKTVALQSNKKATVAKTGKVKPVSKGPAKKATAKKVAGKKTTVKKATSKKTVGKKATSKKATSKKTAGKKTSGKKATSKKATSKKSAGKAR
jgi:adenylate kinase